MQFIDLLDAAIYLVPVVAGLLVLSRFGMRVIRHA